MVRFPISCSTRMGGRGAIRLLLILVCILVRVIALNSDPPGWLSWSTGIWTDEGFYTLDARHEALFHTLAPGNFHDRLLSPLLSLLQQGLFSVFGVGLIQARLVSVVFGLLTVLVFWLGLRRAYGTFAADSGAIFLGLAPPFVFYNRLALQETPTVFWLTLAFTLWVYGVKSEKRQWAWFISAGLVIAAATVFKELALLAVPAFWTRRISFLVTGLGLLLGFALYAFCWYAPHLTELTRMSAYYRLHQIQPHSWLSVWLNLRRGFIGGERGVAPYLAALLPVPCIVTARFLWGRRLEDPSDRFLVLWLSGGLAFCLLSSYAPSRYYVLFLPALIGLAARGMMVVGPRRIKEVLLVLFLTTSAFWIGNAWMSRSSELDDASKELAKTLPSGSRVIGEFAPALCLNTSFAAAPVQPGISNDDAPVERLHASDIAVRQTIFWQNWWQARYPNIVQPSHKVAALWLGEKRSYLVNIYAVKAAH